MEKILILLLDLTNGKKKLDFLLRTQKCQRPRAAAFPAAAKLETPQRRQTAFYLISVHSGLVGVLCFFDGKMKKGLFRQHAILVSGH